MQNEPYIVKEGGLEVPGYLSYPAARKGPAIIVIHEIWGLNENIQDITDRFAAEGYLAFAPDLLTGEVREFMDPTIMREMADPAKKDEAQKKMREALAPTRTPEFAQKTVDRLEACFRFLSQHEASNGSVGVVGFCFGGTYAFALAGAEPDLKFAIAFYGHPPEPAVIEKITCPVLALYGEKDERLIAALPELKANMEKYRKNFRAIVYPGTGHGFFNDKNKTLYDAGAAGKAWIEVKKFLTSLPPASQK